MLLQVNRTKSIFYFIHTIRFDLIVLALFTILITYLAHGKYLNNLMIPLGLVAILGTAMSLILAFRTAQAYDRWWEARTVLGAIVNDSRTFIRQLQLYLPKENHDEIALFAKRQVIWCRALTQSLRNEPFSEDVLEFCSKYQVSASNIPNALLDLHSQHLKSLVKNGLISEFREVQIDSTISKFCDSMGKCERIKSTIFPESYSKLIHLIIYIFALILPFSLDDQFVYIKGGLTILLPSIFIVIEQTAIMMQDPFENKPMDTPMTAISNNIEVNLYQMIGKEFEVKQEVNERHYYVL